MWAQLIKTRIKAGEEAGLERLTQQLRAAEQADSGMVRTTVMRDQADPTSIAILVMFESEDAARARESDPRRGEAMAEVRETMGAILAEPPSFTDLEVLQEYTP